MPRKSGGDLPEEVRTVAEALLSLSYKEGLTRGKIAKQPPLLCLASGRGNADSVAEQARNVEDLIRTQVNAVRNVRDRILLTAGLNLDQEPGLSFEARIGDAVYVRIGEGNRHFLQPESAVGRFRYQLTSELAWRLLGGAPTYVAPRPPSNELELAERLRRQHRDADATVVLERITTDSVNELDRRDAWRSLAVVAYESGDYRKADDAFEMALRNVNGGHRGGKLAVAIDRYARRLTAEERYDHALTVVSQGLAVFFEGRWLWRRYGCIKWYKGELLDAYAALTLALDLGYPASRIFHARGQVLADLGRYEEAIEELDQALSYPRSSLSRAVATSGRSYALGMLGDCQTALEGFRTAEEVIPDSGWLHYWRACCLDRHGNTNSARVGFLRALGAHTPSLTQSKRIHAQEMVDGLARSPRPRVTIAGQLANRITPGAPQRD